MITQEKAERIAQEYAKVGYKDKTSPLLAIGYSKSYAQTLGHKLYNNIKVIEAIKRIDKTVSRKTGITIGYVVENLRDIAETFKADQPAVAVRALELLGKHKGVFELDNAQKAINTRTFNLTQLTAILAADKALVKEIDGISGGIAGDELNV